MTRVSLARSLWTGALCTACIALGCTTLAGLNNDYRVVADASSGSGGESAAAGGQSGSGAGSGGSNAGSAGSDAGAEGGSETCDNGLDDDADGKLDCFDSDCEAATACSGLCSDAIVLPCNTTRSAQTTAAAGATRRIGPPDYSCSAGARSGPELAYRYQGAAGTSVFLQIYGLDGDLGAFAIETMPGAQCNATNSCIGHGDALTGTEPEVLTFTALAARDYFLVVDGPAAAAFNIALICSTNSTCRPARAIQAGQSIAASNAMGSANVTNSQESYSCAFGRYDAPEASFMFTPLVTGNYRIEVSGLTTNLDLFVVAAPDCNSTCLPAVPCMRSTATANESCTLTAQAHTTYFLVIDGFGPTSSFTLNVTQL